MKFWIKEIQRLASEYVMIFLVGNKSDIRPVTNEERKEYQSMADDSGLIYMECSAKTGQGISELFLAIAK